MSAAVRNRAGRCFAVMARFISTIIWALLAALSLAASMVSSFSRHLEVQGAFVVSWRFTDG